MTSRRPETLSRREREIMDIIHALGEATAAEVRERMASPPTNAAVRATLRTLVEKGRLRHRSDGPRYVYHPTVSRERARQSALDHLVQTFFEGSTESAVAALLKRRDADLSPETLRRLLDAARDARRKGR